MEELDPIPLEGELKFYGPNENGLLELRFFGFNTVVSVGVYGPEGAARSALEGCAASCRCYERLFSRTLPHSDIARLNAAGGQPVQVDPRTHDLLQQALRYCACSEGAFDITVGPLVRLWNFAEGIEPSAAELAEAAQHVGWQQLCLREDGGRCWAQLASPQAMVDAGGIAKGWIADALLEQLRAAGMRGAIVNLGGNVAVWGSKPSGEPWRVGVRDPRDAMKTLGSIPLSAGSVVSSGVTERCFERGGRFFHHILDPHTGMPVETELASVSVVAQRSIDAEGFSTTLLALGAEAGGRLARRHPEILQVFFALPTGEVWPLYA